MFNDLASQASDMGFELGSYSGDPCSAVPDERSLGDVELVEPFGVEHAVATIDDASSTMRATMVVGEGDEPTRVLLEQCNG